MRTAGDDVRSPHDVGSITAVDKTIAPRVAHVLADQSTSGRARTAATMAMTGIVAVAVLSTFSMLARYRVRLQLMASIDDTAKLITSYVTTELRRAGGASLKPWQAVAVKECDSPTSGDFRCQYADQLTLAFYDEGAAVTACKITGFTANGGETAGTITVEAITGDSLDSNTTIESVSSKRVDSG